MPIRSEERASHREFGIQQYQAELAELNARYDLQGFQEQMGQLEQELLQR